MNSTIFDFRIVLQGSDTQKFIADSNIAKIIEFDYYVVGISCRKDFALKSSFSSLAIGQTSASYSSIYDFCRDNDSCIKQTLYCCVYGYLYMFDIDRSVIENYKPEFLLRDSFYFSILKLAGYENWGYLKLDSLRLVRGIVLKNSIDTSAIIRYLPLQMQDAFTIVPISDFEKCSIDLYRLKPKKPFGFNSVRIVKIMDTRYISVVSSSQERKVDIYSELVYILGDTISNSIGFFVNTSSENIDDLYITEFAFEYRTAQNRDIGGYVSNFGIMLDISRNDVLGLHSAELYFKYIGE